ACAWLKYSLGYDDALDVFGIHGIGGLLGAVLTGVFALEEIGNAAGAVDGNFWQIWVQFEGVLAVGGWSAVGTIGILFLINRSPACA
ncbi:MAG: ammonium transporter, partial [Gammaproteobacteria bacterium]|nr:ammonium transporter [Gammaproteobacteria bacterium]